jgi:uracil-DNA glycosylase
MRKLRLYVYAKVDKQHAHTNYAHARFFRLSKEKQRKLRRREQKKQQQETISRANIGYFLVFHPSQRLTNPKKGVRYP